MRIRRVIATFAASAYGQAASALQQVAFVAIFTLYWGAEVYGQWLILMALPTYLALGEFGLNSTAANKMSIALQAENSQREFSEILCSVTAMFLGIGFCSGLVLASMYTFGGDTLRSFIALPKDGTGGTVSVQIAAFVSLQLLLGLFSGALRAQQKNPTGIRICGHLRFVELTVTILALEIAPTFVSVLWGLLLSKALILIILIYIVRQQNQNWQWSHIRLSILFKMVPSGAGFIGFTAGWWLLLQGTLLMIGSIAGAKAVVVYSTVRSFLRLSVQLTGLLSSALWPEFTVLAARGDLTIAKTLFRAYSSASVYITALICCVLVSAAPLVIPLWTNGIVGVDHTLATMFAIPVLVSSIWLPSMVYAASTENHVVASLLFSVGAGLAVGVGYLMYETFGLHGVAASALALDLVVAPFLISRVLRALKDDARAWLLDVITCFSLKEILQRARVGASRTH